MGLNRALYKNSIEREIKEYMIALVQDGEYLSNASKIAKADCREICSEIRWYLEHYFMEKV